MKRALVLGFVGVLMVSAPGCGGNDPESLIKQSISDMNALADALEKKEPTDKLKSAAEKLKGTIDKLKNMKLSKDEDERLKKKYEKELTDASMKMISAAGKNPEGAMAIAETLKDMGK
jgi:hypothetical protein